MTDVAAVAMPEAAKIVDEWVELKAPAAEMRSSR